MLRGLVDQYLDSLYVDSECKETHIFIFYELNFVFECMRANLTFPHLKFSKLFKDGAYHAGAHHFSSLLCWFAQLFKDGAYSTTHAHCAAHNSFFLCEFAQLFKGDAYNAIVAHLSPLCQLTRLFKDGAYNACSANLSPLC
jgi:hypothetical protein